jgi:hypothetical protein
MKNLLTFSILLLSLVLFNTSCTKKDDVTPPATSPYVGNWVNDSTTVNDVKNTTVNQYSFNIQPITATMTNTGWTYTSWSVSTNNNSTTITFVDNQNGNVTQTFTVLSAPNNNKMVLESFGNWVTQTGEILRNVPYKYYLHM